MRFHLSFLKPDHFYAFAFFFVDSRYTQDTKVIFMNHCFSFSFTGQLLLWFHFEFNTGIDSSLFEWECTMFR